MRPHYETEADLICERRVAEWISANMNLVLHKLPVSYRIDYAGCYPPPKGDLLYFIEIKCRNHHIDKYPTLLLSMAKYTHGLALSRYSGKDFIIVARFTDCIGIHIVKDNPSYYRFDVSGRTVNTRDSADIEPVVHIPRNKIQEFPLEGLHDGPR